MAINSSLNYFRVVDSSNIPSPPNKSGHTWSWSTHLCFRVQLLLSWVRIACIDGLIFCFAPFSVTCFWCGLSFMCILLLGYSNAFISFTAKVRATKRNFDATTLSRFRNTFLRCLALWYLRFKIPASIFIIFFQLSSRLLYTNKLLNRD